MNNELRKKRIRLMGLIGPIRPIGRIGLICLIGLIAVPASAEAGIKPPPSNLGLVGYWSMDDCRSTKATDFSGSGNTGSLTNFALSTSTSNWVTGNAAKRGCALNFDGTNDYVQLPTNSAYPAVGDVTVSAWVKFISYTSGNRYILDTRSNSGDSNGVAIYRTDTSTLHWNIQTGTYPADPTTDKAATITMNNDAWFHIVAVRSGTTYRIYANGVQSGTDSTGTGNTFSLLDGGGKIGSRAAAEFPFPGSLDDVRIYNRALSPTEVTALYNSGSAKIQTVSQGLVGSWQFSEGAGTSTADTSPSGNTGTLTGFALSGSTSNWVQGRTGSGYALNFDGSNDYVSIPDSTLWDFGTGNFTMSLWAKIVAYDTSGTFLLEQQNSASTGGFEWYINSTNSILFNANGTVNLISKADTPTFNVWRHYVVTRNGTTFTLYANGTSLGANTSATGVSDVSGIIRVGSWAGNSNYDFNGSLDDVRIYNRALSASEVRFLYGQTKINASTAQLQQGTSLASGLVGHWTFDGKYLNTTTSTDTSGSGNNGTLSGGVGPIEGKLGQAVGFDGVDDYISLGNNNFQFNNDFTVSAWVNDRNTGVTGIQQIIGTSGRRWGLGRDSAGIYFAFYDGTLRKISYNATTNQWLHLVGVKSPSGSEFFVDGVSVGTYSSTSSIVYFSGDTDIGGDPSLARYWNGSIDDTRVYNRALSAGEVTQLYNLGR